MHMGAESGMMGIALRLWRISYLPMILFATPTMIRFTLRR